MFTGHNLGQKVLRILHFLTHGTAILQIWYWYGQSCLVGIRNDPAGLPNCFFWGKGDYFVVARAFKCFIFKLNMVTSIFLHIFVQDCGLWL